MTSTSSPLNQTLIQNHSSDIIFTEINSVPKDIVSGFVLREEQWVAPVMALSCLNMIVIALFEIFVIYKAVRYDVFLIITMDITMVNFIQRNLYYIWFRNENIKN